MQTVELGQDATEWQVKEVGHVIAVRSRDAPSRSTSDHHTARRRGRGRYASRDAAESVKSTTAVDIRRLPILLRQIGRVDPRLNIVRIFVDAGGLHFGNLAQMRPIEKS
jgi:hypothetical protein